MKKPLLVALPALALAAALAAALHRPAGADASPTRPLVVAAEASRVVADGRVVTYPGAEVTVGTDFAGTVVELLVSEKDRVAKGQPIARLDASVEERALQEARARVAEAEADLRLAEAERARAEQLLAGNVGSRQALEKAERDRDAASARRETALAESERLRALVAKSRLFAPIDGVVTERWVDAGETVDRGARVVTIADLSRLRVEAEVDEADTARVAAGTPVAVKAEGETRAWRGTVEEVPDAVTTRRLKPQDPARPTDTRVLLVKVALLETEGLKLGRRVELLIGDPAR